MITDHKLQDQGELHLCVEVYVVFQDKVLMHRRSNQKKHFPGYLIGPGGHINVDENVAEAACREVQEETGIIVEPASMKLKYVGIHNHVDTHTIWVNWGFISQPEKLKGEIKDSKEGTSEWIEIRKLQEVRKDIFPPSLEYLDHLIKNAPGILYTSSDWKNNKLFKLTSSTIVKV